MKLIDKDALVAKIEKLRAKWFGINNDFADGQKGALTDVLSLIDTLEVKEVNLDAEIANYNMEYVDENGFFNTEHFAKHFFELGLQAQHDNWKVVDNINPPQADRNKIYCVFTKQRYILAKVIDHPQDDGLLQWKCTEFPNHRYDMCEGDKYMQIV